ncbi:MAG: AfsA-related hotdog domain-containing protein [Magnetospirillum sp.]|nr:AfsA-related hotdog domain-containing protein [Magnetospirillum sp.]
MVGDKFANFGANKDVLTISQLRGFLSLPRELVLDRERIALIPGQGLSDGDVLEVSEKAAHSAVRASCDLSRWPMTAARAQKDLSHKHHPRNTMISVPRRLNDDTYEIDVMIDDGCELMGDHQTGQHLQGMMIVEAARQAFIAVTELSIDASAVYEKYFVFDSLSVEYKRFMFPVSISLLCTIDFMEKTANSYRFRMHIDAQQAGDLVATIAVTFGVVKYKSLSRIESTLATACLEKYVKATTTPISENAPHPNTALAS